MTTLDTGATAWPVRRLSDQDWPELLRVDELAFGFTPPADLTASERELHEDGRGLGAYDGAALVGIATAFSYRLSIPGGALPAAAVSWVGVLPTHRRRGVLSALMARQIADIHERAVEPIAILWASEPVIYGRYGYGLATHQVSWTVPRDARALATDTPADPAVRLRLTEPDPALLAAVYARVGATRPGVPDRDARWWRRATRDLPAQREGKSALRCVVAEDDGGIRGYALYATKHDFSANFAAGTVTVREVLAVDPPARAALYRFLFNQDLMGRTELWNVPVDDPLVHWLTNPRTAKPKLADALYVRLVDLAAALAARRYTRSVEVVLEVADPLCPWNSGRWKLSAGPDVATCTSTADPGDLQLGVRELGAAYLGGTSLTELADAGRVREVRPGALAAATAAFSVAPAPWCPAVF